MLLIQKMEQTKFPPSESAAVKFILENPRKVRELTVRQIAQESYTVPATLIRVAKRLDFKGWTDFTETFLSEYDYLESHFEKIDANRPFEAGDNQRIIANKISALCIDSINDTLELLDYRALNRAVQLMCKAENIYICATSVSMDCTYLFKRKMQRIGKYITLEHENGEQAFTTITATSKDCAIVVSYSGSTDPIVLQAQTLHSNKVPIILISSIGDNLVRKYAQCCLSISTREKLYSKISSFSSEESIHLLLNILFACYFATDYEKHWNKKIAIAKQYERARHTTNQIMLEAEEHKL